MNTPLLVVLAVAVVAALSTAPQNAGVFVRMAQLLDRLHPAPCADVDVDAPIPFEPTVRGWGWLDEASEMFVVTVADGDCPTCIGTGEVEQRDLIVGGWIPVTCQSCNGSGERGAA